MTTAILIYFAIVIAAMIFQGIFAGYETGFITVDPFKLRNTADENKDTREGRLFKYTRNPDQMLAMLLIGTNVGTVAGSIAGTKGFTELSPAYGGLIATAVVTTLYMLFAEIIPKSIFRLDPVRLTIRFLPFIEFWYAVFAPLAWPVSVLTRFVFRQKGSQALSPLMSSREDVRVLVDETANHGTIDPEEQEMIHSVINLQATQAKEIMTPRIDIQAVADSANRSDVLNLMVSSGRTRIPVYRESVDEIVGVITAHDIMMDTSPEDASIVRFIREIPHFPDSMRIDDLFQYMKKNKQHMVVVIDEYGGTDGLITLEDVLEEIFGDIRDEHDQEEDPIHQVGPDNYIIDARMPLEDAAKSMNLPLMDEEVETVGGWVMRVAGRIPSRGEVIEHVGFRITVLDSSPNTVFRIRLDVLPEARGSSAPKD
ncbi:MAG: hemolysin [Candidatus Hydrogenedentota bacterium]